MSVEKLLQQLGIQYRVIEDEAYSSCPFHSPDDHPSWYINIRSGLHHCLGGSTKVLTWDGYKEIRFLAGTTQKIVTVNGRSVNWVEAPFKSYGVQKLYDLTLSRNGIEKHILATKEHRWFAKTSGSGTYLERMTIDLKPGYRLQSARIPGSGNISVSPWGVAHGFTYGDGTLDNTGSRVTLWGDKDKALEDFFPFNVRYKTETVNGVKGQTIEGLPKFFKSLPNIDETPRYLYGWLAGYFAADGCVSDDGTPTIASAKLENLLFVRLLAIRLGIITHSIKTQYRLGMGKEVTPLYSLTFSRRSLSKDFFIIDEHRKRWLANNDVKERTGWVVVSVTETDIEEEVYCAEVDGTHNFVLEDNIVTGNCFSCGARGNLGHLIVRLSDVSYAEAVIQANDIVGAARVGEWQENYYGVSFSPPAIKVTEADKALFTDPPREALHDKNITLDAAQYYGIQWNPEHESWICPYYDPYSNELWGWQEKNKRIFRNFPAGTKKSKTLFGYPQLKNMSAMLVESPVDCAVANSAGYENTVASFGLPNVYQLYLMQIRVDSLIFALDNDGPGKKATRELIPEALKMFRNVKVLPYLYTKAKDIGEMEYQSIRTEIAEAEPALAWIRGNSG